MASSRARLVATRHGTLAIRFHWRGRPVWEGTGAADTPENRAHLAVICARITDELARGAFDDRRYLAYFPNGNQARRCQAGAAVVEIPTVRAYAAEFLERTQREGQRVSTWRTYRSHLLTYVIDTRLPDGVMVGDLRVNEITKRRLIQLRTALLQRVSVATAKVVMSGGLRVCLNAARDDELLEGDPFAGLPRWPRQESPSPDPFTRDERDRICAHFRGSPWGPFVFWQFHVGTRPSEATALRHSDLNTDTGMCRITRSRVGGEEDEPKTAGSRRTIQVVPAVLGELRRLAVLRPDPDGYVFTAPTGGPIDQKQFAQREWAAALRLLEIRPRKFYATRHTFLSIGVSLGRNFKWLATYCGTSARMIDRHYAIYLPDAGGEQLEALATEAEKSQAAAAQASEKAGPARSCHNLPAERTDGATVGKSRS